MSDPWSGPPALPTTPTSPDDDEARAATLAAVYANLLQLAAITSPRSRQTSIGSSEAGHACDRRLVYRLVGAEPVNIVDPWPMMVGSGVHMAVAEAIERIAKGSGRFRVEVPVSFRGIRGTCDLYDRYSATVIDFKTTKKARLAKIRKEGPPKPYLVQLQLYAAGLKAAGESPASVALIYFAIDGTLADAWAWVGPVDAHLAHDAVDRMVRLQDETPLTAKASPDRFCTSCAYFLPGSADLAVGCPGLSTTDIHKGES